MLGISLRKQNIKGGKDTDVGAYGLRPGGCLQKPNIVMGTLTEDTEFGMKTGTFRLTLNIARAN
jgi:hypothetical protein